MTTTVNEDNNDKIKVPDEFIFFGSVRLLVLTGTAELDE